MLIKVEKYTAENGLHHKVEYFGKDADHISGKIDSPIIAEREYTSEEAKMLLDNGVIDDNAYHILIGEPIPEPMPELPATEQSIYETQANTEYLIALSELQ